MTPKLSVSILDADFSCIKDTVRMLVTSKVDMIHFDVMDGNFVPNLTFGAKIIKPLRKLSKQIFDTHLMIKNPEKYMLDFVNAGCDIITIHYEATKNIYKIIQMAKKFGIKLGMSIKPQTPVSVLEKYLPYLDLVLVMSVEPGFGGQKFMKFVLQKIKSLKKIKISFNYKYLIEIDGGINLNIAPAAIKAGVDILVVGSAIFSSKNPKKTLVNFKNLVKKYSVK